MTECENCEEHLKTIDELESKVEDLEEVIRGLESELEDHLENSREAFNKIYNIAYEYI